VSGMKSVEIEERSADVHEDRAAREDDGAPGLIEACESVCRGLAGKLFVADNPPGLEDWGEILDCQASSIKELPSAEVLRRIIWIARTRAADWRAVRAKKLVLEFFAERYGDPSDIWVVLLKSACEDLDLSAARVGL